jgi:hypothetical protein
MSGSDQKSESKLMENVLKAGKRPDAAQLSKALKELRSADFLTTKNIETIEGWIKTEFPSSIRYLARELLKGEEETEDEKEREEKIPSWDARNICSGDTQNNLTGDEMPRDLKDVVSFLLPKGGKSECIMESDLGKIVGPKGDDQVYLYDPKANQVIMSVLIYRLPSSGIWILGSAPYLRMLKAYQLELFGKHIISSETHQVSSVWRQEHELFLVKPLHYEDFKSLIVNNTKLPASPAACSCLFKPRLEDWSETFKTNYPTEECEWLIPTWNGFPVILGQECGKLLNWDYEKIESESHTTDEKTENDTSRAEAQTIINGFWKMINNKLSFYGDTENLLFVIESFPMDANMTINIPPNTPINISASGVGNVIGRDAAADFLAAYLTDDFTVSIDIKIPNPSISGESIESMKSNPAVDYDEIRVFKDSENQWHVSISDIIFYHTNSPVELDEKQENQSALPTSFLTGTDIADWMRAILVSRQLTDYRSRNRIEIVPDSANTIGMRLVLNWSGELTIAVTPSTLEDEYERIVEYDNQANLRTAELRIAAHSLQGADSGSVFFMRPWHSGHVTNNGVLIMNWTASDLADESENEGSETESEGEETE